MSHKNHISSKSKKSTTLVNLNVQCLSTKINKLEYILNTSKNVDFLTITEHWMTKAECDSFSIANYSVAASFCRQQSKHGGVMLLSKNTQATKPIDINKFNVEKIIEMCGIQAININAIIIVIYRPPNADAEIFVENLNEMLNEIRNKYKSKTLFLCGDYNICVGERSKISAHFLEALTTNGLKTIFEEPSRINGTRCIDNICVEKFFNHYIITTKNWHMGDHLAQQVIFTTNGAETNKRNIIKKRIITPTKINNFKTILKARNFDEIYNTGLSASESFTKFHNIIIDTYNLAFPEIEIKENSKPKKITWETEKLRTMRNQLDAVYTIITSSNQHQFLEMYNRMKKHYEAEVDKAKKEANSKIIQEAENKVLAAWQLVKIETGNAAQKNTEKSTVTAESLNNKFLDAGKTISNSVNIKDPTCLMKKFSTNSLFFSYTTIEEVTKIIKNLKNKTTKDIYGLSVTLLKEIEPIISKHLSNIINKCLSEGIFPDQLKHAKITPIFKKGDKNDESNYRPISILPTISKVFETIIRNRLTCFLQKYNIIDNCQHGYTHKRSTSTALMQVTSEILSGLNKQEYTQAAFLDLSKAFDTINHSILLKKLYNYGVRGCQADLIASYLQGRKQQVEWNGVTSSSRMVEKGVPQGSILGPILFVLYVNDFPGNIQTRSTCLYADDTTLLNCDKEINNVKEKTKNSIEEAQRWFEAHELQLNKDKTNILTFYSKKTTEVTGSSARFLGVIFNENLSWNDHLHYLTQKLASSIFCIRSITKNITLEVGKNVYFAYFHAIATYGILIWGTSSSLQTIFKLQKRAIRSLLGMAHAESCRSKFRELGILTILSSYIMNSVLYAYTYQDTFTKNNENHTYNTRYNEDFVIPLHRLTKSQQNSFEYWSIKLYRKVPEIMKTLPPKKFKREIKEFLIKGEFYSLEEYLLY